MNLTLEDPNQRFTVELIKGAMNATRREMEALITRTAMSPFIREKKDFFTAILNANGELVVSTSLTLAGNLVDKILEVYPIASMQNGDLYWYNDPYATKGAVSHLPDMVFIMPVFSQSEVVAFVVLGTPMGYRRCSSRINQSSCTIRFRGGIMIPPVGYPTGNKMRSF